MAEVLDSQRPKCRTYSRSTPARYRHVATRSRNERIENRLGGKSRSAAFHFISRVTSVNIPAPNTRAAWGSRARCNIHFPILVTGHSVASVAFRLRNTPPRFVFVVFDFLMEIMTYSRSRFPQTLYLPILTQKVHFPEIKT